jgi:hypothetical protein
MAETGGWNVNLRHGAVVGYICPFLIHQARISDGRISSR